MDNAGALSRSFKAIGVAKPAPWVRVGFRGIRRVQTADDVLRHARAISRSPMMIRLAPNVLR
jgi:hypothetical protein